MLAVDLEMNGASPTTRNFDTGSDAHKMGHDSPTHPIFTGKPSLMNYFKSDT